LRELQALRWKPTLVGSRQKTENLDAEVHRDIEPGNILLDIHGKQFLSDFGLAFRERDLDKGPRYAGTPAYMNPEQASGEGHRVDGRR
jgi:serine/threonine protein kinase